jgi:hypothetical protein
LATSTSTASPGESLIERIVAVHGHRLAEAMALQYDDQRRDRLMDDALAEVPDELLADIAQEAAGTSGSPASAASRTSDERGDEEPKQRRLDARLVSYTPTSPSCRYAREHRG